MNKDIGSQLRNEIRALYQEDEGAAAFFDWAAHRVNDAAETSVDRISDATGISYSMARELAKDLCELGCGEFIVGRKGWKTRVRWGLSLRSLGKAASGEDVEIEKVDPILIEEAAEQIDTAPVAEPAKVLTIAEAKRRLSETLGVPEQSIEITIKA